MDDLFGLELTLPETTFHVGEVRQIGAIVDTNYYQPDWAIQSENNDIAMVFFDGHIVAQHTGETTVYIRAKVNPEKVSLAPDDDGIRKTTVKITVTDADDDALTDTQEAELDAVQRKEDGCRFPRKKAVIKGFLDDDAPRLTLNAVNQMIDESDSFTELYCKLTDTYLKTWNSIPPHKPNILSTFLGKIVRNLSFNKYKANHTMKRGGNEISVILDEISEIVSNNESVEDEVITKELEKAINDFINTFSDLKRYIFIRRYWYSDKISVIAYQCGKSENYVHVELNRIRKQLRNYLIETC